MPKWSITDSAVLDERARSRRGRVGGPVGAAGAAVVPRDDPDAAVGVEQRRPRPGVGAEPVAQHDGRAVDHAVGVVGPGPAAGCRRRRGCRGRRARRRGRSCAAAEVGMRTIVPEPAGRRSPRAATCRAAVGACAAAVGCAAAGSRRPAAARKSSTSSRSARRWARRWRRPWRCGGPAAARRPARHAVEVEDEAGGPMASAALRVMGDTNGASRVTLARVSRASHLGVNDPVNA